MLKVASVPVRSLISRWGVRQLKILSRMGKDRCPDVAAAYGKSTFIPKLGGKISGVPGCFRV
jgi:hypothetical protein